MAEAEALPIFAGLSPERRQDLLANAILHSVPPGAVLFEQGEVPNFQLIVVAGSAQLLGRSAAGREVLIETVRAPDLIIPAAVVSGAPYLMQARVPEASRFLLVQADVFRSAVAADPQLARAVIGSLDELSVALVRGVIDGA